MLLFWPTVLHRIGKLPSFVGTIRWRMEVKIKACKKPSMQWSHSPCWAVICIISLAYLVHNSEHIELQTTCKCLQTNRLRKISNMIHQISVAQYQGYTLWYLRYGHVGKRFQVIVHFAEGSNHFEPLPIEYDPSFWAATLLTNAWLWKSLAHIVTIPCLVAKEYDITQVEVWNRREVQSCDIENTGKLLLHDT